MDNFRSIFESRISAGATEKLPATKATGELDAETISSWSCHMEGHAKNVWKDVANLRTKLLSNYTKLQRHAWMIINLKKKIGSVGELSTVCSQIVLKC